ncbi:MAG: methyltransferase domain-containing protein [Candidatus Eisenbacteria bacterium]|uniref:Methyltransferase domain-containing protein n=1 Tax=Eiseniibacteriota bacterium TaxID=2212470 RepID=A0A956SEE4_UNCEI|nr:methyltransferase domain-containing protein [Candidatus Eisenbacteria bacterium]
MTTQETRQPIARESEPLKSVRSLGLGGVRFDGETIRSWIRALVGVDSKLQAGALVADVTCGVGTATLALALAYPRSTFRGFDPHEPSISEAREAAIQSQVTNVRFERVAPHEFPGRRYELITTFRPERFSGDIRRIVTRIREALSEEGGVWMLVLPKRELHVHGEEEAAAHLGTFSSVRIAAETGEYTVLEAVR